MKQILLENNEIRLDTLRKVFQIDKYKRIKENIQLYLRFLRQKININQIKTEGVEQKEESYTKSGLEEEVGKELSNRLVRLMEDQKPFTNSELSLRNLADMLEISPHNLTEVINKYSNKNFYDFVNAYRVEEVKARIRNQENNNYTLLAIGLESGFNSKSSFNSVFKKHTGQTPSQYKKSLQIEKKELL